MMETPRPQLDAASIGMAHAVDRGEKVVIDLENAAAEAQKANKVSRVLLGPLA